MKMYQENQKQDTVQANKASDGTALVVVAEKALDDYRSKVWGRGRTASGRSTGNGSASRAGRAAANRVGLNKGVSTGGSVSGYIGR
tara:strand:- start:1575 stop:1832 length:258 start_codon:yes stop_codon:yes gene_type:complete